MRLARADALARSCGHFLICVGSIFQCKYHWTGGWWGPCGLFTVKVATKIDRPETLLIPSGRSSSSFWLFPLWTAASYYCSHQRCLTQVRRGFLLVRPPFVLCAFFLGCTGGGSNVGLDRTCCQHWACWVLPTDLTPATPIWQAEAHHCCPRVVQIFSVYRLLRQEVVMPRIIGDIIVQSMALYRCRWEERKVGIDSGLHKPEPKKAITLETCMKILSIWAEILF